VARRRDEVGLLRTRYGVSERRALRAMGWPRSSHRYRSVASPHTELRVRLKDLALARPRYGYRRLHALLRREGWLVNHKLVYRLYSEEGLTVRVKRRKKLAAEARVPPPTPELPDERWTMDFLSDRLADGRRLRVLTVLDICTRECLALHAGASLGAEDVTRVLEGVLRTRSVPATIQVDNGTEFTSRHFDLWAWTRGRDECLGAHWLESIEQARRVLREWQKDYNEVRPHSRLGGRTPKEFAARLGGHGRPDEQSEIAVAC
jgi:putative transposase